MKGLVFLYCILNAGNQQVMKLIAKGIKSHHKTRQNVMQKMPFYLPICGILEISKDQTEKQLFRLWNYRPKVSLMNNWK